MGILVKKGLFARQKETEELFKERQAIDEEKVCLMDLDYGGII
jgi:hypothetical protein